MPLTTQIIRNGEPLKVRWGDFHIAAMALAAGFESKEGPLGDMAAIYENVKHVHPYMPFPISRGVAFYVSTYPALATTPLNEGNYTLKYGHSFIDLADREVLVLLPGDELVAYRSF
jgi:hypothetical protein